MKHYSHLHTAATVLTQYKGLQPFGLFLKEFFRADKKYGSKDRKRITGLCYNYFRLGKLAADAALEDRLLLGLFVCAAEPDELLQAIRPEWNQQVTLTPEEKLALAGYAFSPAALFPATDMLEAAIDANAFSLSHFQQPDLFLRLRPGSEQKVKAKLHETAVPFRTITESCLALPNASKLDDVLVINKEAVIQDKSSQRVAEFLQFPDGFSLQHVWDCCAASGGKSMLVYDQYPQIQLVVSDVRENILINLSKRFREAGISRYKGFVADLSRVVNPGRSFDLIIADVPCTGSGTWGRTPEQLLFFKEEKIKEYANRQRQIALHTWQHLRPGGYFLYITCSVYRQENTEAVAFIQKETGLKLIRSSMLEGYADKADTLFAALFQK
jgi:16S rRNA (cytosine967-C5)-methyltransferase